MNPCPECGRRNHHLSELWTDPSSGEWSMSRFGMFLVIVIFIPAAAVFHLYGFKLNIWEHLTTIMATLGGIYGANSVAGAVSSALVAKKAGKVNGIESAGDISKIP